MATKRIIVTGGTGKAGRWIVKHLLERGYDWKQEFHLR
jgi:nucleoside-diphosphate-sugar epimerase